MAPREFTASLWEEVNTLKKLSRCLVELGRGRRQRNFMTDSNTGQRASRMQKSPCSNGSWGGNAAHATVASIDKAQLPPLPTCFCVDVEEKYEEGRMNPEPTELESPSAVTSLETPGHQCPPNGETGRTSADIYLLLGMGSNQGETLLHPQGRHFFIHRGDTSSSTERVGTRADSKITIAPTAPDTTFLQARRKPNDKKPLSEENKQFDLRERRRATTIAFSFPGGNAGHGMLVVCASCFCVFCPNVPVCPVFPAVKCGRRRGSRH